MKRLLLVLAALAFSCSVLFAQQVVKGTVTDTDTGEGLEGVAVVVKGTTIGILTDGSGKYSLEVPSDAKVLMFTFVGKTTQEVAMTGQSSIDVSLGDNPINIKEVVVTALGISRERKALGYAVQDVSGSAIQNANTVSLVDGLNGQVSGVNITNASGSAGGSSRIVIRGMTSLSGNNQALVVVDGVKINNSELATEINGGGKTAGVALSNRVMDINPDDIETVTVLKGAGATALYGVEGARGVIVITTKMGKSKPGKGIGIEFSETLTFRQVNKLPELQSKYAQGVSGTWLGPDAGTFWKATSFGPSVDTLYWDGSDYDYDKNGRIVGQSDPSKGKKVTPYDNLGTFFVTGKATQTNFAISAGGPRASYRLSTAYFKEDGVVPNNTFERINLGLSSKANFLHNKLHATTSFKYIRSGGERIQQGSNISGLMLGLLRTPITFDNANGNADPINDPTSYYRANGSPRNYRGGRGYDNPYWTVNNTPFNDRVNRMLASVQLSYDAADWLTISTNIGSDFYSDRRKQAYEIGSNSFRAGRIVEDQYFNRQLDAYLNFSGNFDLNADGDLTMGYNLGGNVFTSYLNNLYAQGDGLGFSGFLEMSNTANPFISSSISRRRSAAVFGSLDFGFKNYLYLTLTGRRDLVSTLIDPTKEFKSGDISIFYPSASMSFVFSELMGAESNTFTFGKLRLSYARTGNGAPGAYLTSTVFVPAAPADGWTNGISYPFAGVQGWTLSNTLGNKNLVPAFTTDLEVGLDLRFLNNRLGLDIAAYTRKSENEILAVPIAQSTGYSSVVLNSGKLSTKGLEVTLTAVPVKTKNFSWDLNVNFTQYTTIIDALAEGVESQFIGGFTGTGLRNVVGQEYGQLYGGAFQRANTADGKSFDALLDRNPAGALIIGADGFPMVDPLPRPIGNPNPDYILGINNTLSFKGASLGFLFDIKQGGEMWNGTQGALTFFGMSKLSEERDAYGVTDAHYVFGTDKRFPYESNGAILEDGSANNIKVNIDEDWYTGNGGGFGAVDEGFVQSTSWVRLRLLTLAYTLPKNIVSKTPLSGIKVAFTGRNLWLSTPYEGVDPETSLLGANANGQGFDYFNNPGTKSYAFSLNLSF